MAEKPSFPGLAAPAPAQGCRGCPRKNNVYKRISRAKGRSSPEDCSL